MAPKKTKTISWEDVARARDEPALGQEVYDFLAPRLALIDPPQAMERARAFIAALGRLASVSGLSSSVQMWDSDHICGFASRLLRALAPAAVSLRSKLPGRDEMLVDCLERAWTAATNCGWRIPESKSPDPASQPQQPSPQPHQPSQPSPPQPQQAPPPQQPSQPSAQQQQQVPPQASPPPRRQDPVVEEVLPSPPRQDAADRDVTFSAADLLRALDRLRSPSAEASVVEELARSRLAASRFLSSHLALDDFSSEEQRILLLLPPYNWLRADPQASVIVRALRQLAREVAALQEVGPRLYTATLSARLAAIRRYVDINQAAEAATLIALAADNDLAPRACFPLCELALLADPDLPVTVVLQLRASRICRPAEKDDLSSWLAGTVVPVAATLLPTRQPRRDNNNTRAPGGANRRPNDNRAHDNRAHDNRVPANATLPANTPPAAPSPARPPGENRAQQNRAPPVF